MADLDRLAQRLKEEPRSLAFVAYAEGLRKSNRVAEAWVAIAEGLRQHPDLPSARLVAARLHLGDGRAALALEILIEVVAAEPANDAARVLLAKLLLDVGRFVEARGEIARLSMGGVGEAAALSARLPATSGGPPAVTIAFDSVGALAVFLSRCDFASALRLAAQRLRDNPYDQGCVEWHADISRACNGALVPRIEAIPARPGRCLPGVAALRRTLWAEAAEWPAPQPSPLSLGSYL